VVQSAFGFQGQKCSACAKVVVVGNAYEPFLARLKPMVEQLHLGAATDPHFHVNAVIDAKAKAKIEGYIATGRSTGKVLAEVAKTNAAGHFIPPIVFTDLPENSPLIHEEIFGPVLVVQHAQTLDEALQKAQHAEYALTGGLFSRNPASIAKIQKEYRVGNLYINRTITGATVGRHPFGGGKLSGTGTKAGGADYLLNFLEPRTLCENTLRRGFAPEKS
jgi:RHH-type proline utilization regulon transcriptional repressor/proline dehydrogenase/delta 1-pyrroline-5-carboxylate dehydrogenase